MSDLSCRDALLSKLAGCAWPFDMLLDIPQLPDTATILDIGAAEGQLLERLRQRGHNGLMLGLDPLPGPGQVLGHAEALPLPNAQFEVVLLIRTLLHVTDPAQALREAWRVLKVGGQLVVAVQGGLHLAAFWALAEPEAERLSADAATAQLISDWPFQRTELVLPVLLRPQDVRELAESYGLALPLPSYELSDQLQLVIFALKKGG